MNRAFSIAVWAIAVLYVAVSVLVRTGIVPSSLDAPLTALLPMAFALIHGSRQYGWRSILIERDVPADSSARN